MVKTMLHPFIKCVGAIAALMIGTSSLYAQDAEPTKILFIGNSYTHNNNMPGIFEKIAKASGKEVLVVKNTRSGASFREHTGREDMYEAIRSEQWDYVVLQGFSREFSHLPTYMDTATIPFVRQITDSIYRNNPCTNVLLYMTWGYEGGFEEREEVNTYEKMADSIERGYRYAGDVFGVPVVPVGMVWKDVKSNTTIDLYAKDRAHPSMNGSFLIATTFFNAIFDGSNKRIFTRTIRSADADTIKQTALNYITANREKYHLDGNRFTIKSYITPKGDYMLDFMSNFPAASSVSWSFGDRKSLAMASGQHKYRKHGRYLVQLTVQDDCGERVYEREIEYEKPPRPRRRNRKEPKYNVGNEKKI